MYAKKVPLVRVFQHTAARRRLDFRESCFTDCIQVSTHSRPKAAGSRLARYVPDAAEFQHTAARRRLGRFRSCRLKKTMFQHTAARRRLVVVTTTIKHGISVSTHSRPKAAGPFDSASCQTFGVSTHSRPKAAGTAYRETVRPDQSFNTQPPEGGWGFVVGLVLWYYLFQHTAARRRLEQQHLPIP